MKTAFWATRIGIVDFYIYKSVQWYTEIFSKDVDIINMFIKFYEPDKKYSMVKNGLQIVISLQWLIVTRRKK